MIKSREMQEARHVARVGENKNAYIGFVGKPGEKKTLEQLVGNNKTDLDANGCVTGISGSNPERAPCR